jgi:SagB-type dehydrogenase family enzyme
MRLTLEALLGRPVDERFAALFERLALAAEAAADEPGASLAHVLHAATRTSVTADGAPPEDMPVLAAPPLEIGNGSSAGAALVPLPPSPSDNAAAAHVEIRRLLDERRSMPYFARRPLSLVELADLLDTAVGSRGMQFAYNRGDVPSRRFPSAGGLQPLDFHVLACNIDTVEPGHYRFDPVQRTLALEERGDFRVPLIESALETDWLFHAPAVVALVGRLDRCFWKYGSRGYRFLNVDTGVAAMSLSIVAQADGLAANCVAAFDDDKLNALLRLDGRDAFVNLLFAVGHRPPRWS